MERAMSSHEWSGRPLRMKIIDVLMGRASLLRRFDRVNARFAQLEQEHLSKIARLEHDLRAQGERFTQTLAFYERRIDALHKRTAQYFAVDEARDGGS
jgi:hypothetical protein